MNFGDVYFIPRNKHSNPLLEGHWVVLLYGDEYNVYLQSFCSKMVKVFPNFSCRNCVIKEHAPVYIKYKNNPRLYLDTDILTFINFNKYKFLSRETYLSFKNICKDNYFNFNDLVAKNRYKYCGKLNLENQRGILLSIRNSTEISRVEKDQIFGYYTKSKDSV